jgi:hypothetical protein
LKSASPGAQADAILTLTEGPGDGFLDNGSAFGVYSRLDLTRLRSKLRREWGNKRRSIGQL